MFTATIAFTQDLITFKNGTIEKVTVKEVTESEIKYQKINATVLYTVKKSSLFSVQYQNGSKEPLGEAIMIPPVIIEAVNSPKSEATKATQKPVIKNTLIPSPPRNEEIKPEQSSDNKQVIQPIYTKKEYSDMFQQGQNDAKIYYRGYKGAGTGTFLTTFLLNPVLGLIPAIACSSTSPNESNMSFPRAELKRDIDYMSGYTQEAKAKKTKKVWGNFGIATGVYVVVVAALLSNVKR